MEIPHRGLYCETCGINLFTKVILFERNKKVYKQSVSTKEEEGLRKNNNK